MNNFRFCKPPSRNTRIFFFRKNIRRFFRAFLLLFYTCSWKFALVVLAYTTAPCCHIVCTVIKKDSAFAIFKRFYAHFRWFSKFQLLVKLTKHLFSGTHIINSFGYSKIDSYFCCMSGPGRYVYFTVNVYFACGCHTRNILPTARPERIFIKWDVFDGWIKWQFTRGV